MIAPNVAKISAKRLASDSRGLGHHTLMPNLAFQLKAKPFEQIDSHVGAIRICLCFVAQPRRHAGAARGIPYGPRVLWVEFTWLLGFKIQNARQYIAHHHGNSNGTHNALTEWNIDLT